MKVKKESEKAGLNIQIQSSWYPILSLHANRWGNNGNSDRLLSSWAPKSLQMVNVNAAMKVKDACSLEEKL